MKLNDPAVAILGIGTSIPEHRLDQAEAAQRIAQALNDSAYPNSARWAKRIFRQCGVNTRYTCEPNLLKPADQCRYLSFTSNHLVPTTAERMDVFKKQSVPLAVNAAKKALTDGQVDSTEVTHLITISCTGQFLPGLDAVLVKQLGLSSAVNRIPLNFLGCAAGLKGICLARQLVDKHPSAKVLVVSVELCTLHIQPSSERDALFGASFFGDGASACIIGCKTKQQGIFQLGKDRSILLPGGEEDMVWEVGNYGFDLYLSPEIPRLIGRFVPEQVEHLLGGEPKPDLWAIHPGGKGIIDTLADVFALTEEQTMPSRTVLRDYGNLSSATILFVMQAMRQQMEQDEKSKNGMAIAFGPGLSCEMISFKYVPKVELHEQLLDESYV